MRPKGCVLKAISMYPSTVCPLEYSTCQWKEVPSLWTRIKNLWKETP